MRALDCDATYLLWLDCRDLLAARDGASVAELVGFLHTRTGLILSSGDIYGAGGEGFIRMNLGTQRSRVEDGVARFVEGCRAFAGDGVC